MDLEEVDIAAIDGLEVNEMGEHTYSHELIKRSINYYEKGRQRRASYR